jgi:hypothetical protein
MTRAARFCHIVTRAGYVFVDGASVGRGVMVGSRSCCAPGCSSVMLACGHGLGADRLRLLAVKNWVQRWFPACCVLAVLSPAGGIGCMTSQVTTGAAKARRKSDALRLPVVPCDTLGGASARLAS